MLAVVLYLIGAFCLAWAIGMRFQDLRRARRRNMVIVTLHCDASGMKDGIAKALGEAERYRRALSAKDH